MRHVMTKGNPQNRKNGEKPRIRNKKIDFRLTAEKKRLIYKAAFIEGVTVTEFIEKAVDDAIARIQ